EGGAELGPLGSAIDQMASSLNQMISTMRDEALNASFEKQLAGALDMTDREAQVATVAARAMGEVSVAHAMELLISDSSLAHMARAAEHPSAGAPGCRVGSPYDCVAVRRGNLITFDDSEALDACPQLRGRPCGGLSAVCVPVTFMGRAIGVLHSTGPVDLPMTPDQVRKVGNLGTQLGMRLGTVRAFEKSQIQARTDGLTGLPNRRTLERQMHLMAASDKPFALVMCDLDHFKRLNDTFGHAAGDSALRVFSDVLRHSLREADLVGRWGGEEFVFVLAQSHSHAAAEMVGRLRARLAATLQLGKVPEFTASFGVADSTLTREPDRLVQLADVALYQAKAQGRDRACLAEPSMEFELDEHRRMLRGTDGATEASSGLASMFAEEA
ncbi:MAG: sensor domain-containing diguanylate cyclase, partial [Burkholderiaceae bacterium]